MAYKLMGCISTFWQLVSCFQTRKILTACSTSSSILGCQHFSQSLCFILENPGHVYCTNTTNWDVKFVGTILSPLNTWLLMLSVPSQPSNRELALSLQAFWMPSRCNIFSHVFSCICSKLFFDNTDATSLSNSGSAAGMSDSLDKASAMALSLPPWYTVPKL